MIAQDPWGNAVSAGDRIVYAITKGRSACLVEAVVLEVLPKKGYSDQFRLKVRPIKDSFGTRWSTRAYDPGGGFSKPGTKEAAAVTLQRADRFMVLS